MNEYMPPVQPGRAPRRSPASGATRTWIAFAGDPPHLALVPVSGVGEHDVGITDVELGEFALGGTDHRFEVPEVR
jgi:hypothetical protein